MINEIYQNHSRYPEELLAALANNPEMADFVSGYPDSDGVKGGITASEKEQEFPLFLQWDPRWEYEPYGEIYGHIAKKVSRNEICFCRPGGKCGKSRRTIKREDIRIGCMAKFLSKLACPAGSKGYGVGVPIKMQYAINKIGILRILFASMAGGLFKAFGIKGVFYKIAGPEISGLDGFYDGAWEEYRDIGIEIPYDSTTVCNEIKQKLGISCMIVDANDLGQEILGKSDDIRLGDKILKKMIRDDPARQDQQRTPLILIRKKYIMNQ